MKCVAEDGADGKRRRCDAGEFATQRGALYFSYKLAETQAGERPGRGHGTAQAGGSGPRGESSSRAQPHDSSTTGAAIVEYRR